MGGGLRLGIPHHLAWGGAAAPGTCSELGQRGVGVRVLLLDGLPAAVASWAEERADVRASASAFRGRLGRAALTGGLGGGGRPPEDVVQEQDQCGSHRGQQAQAQGQAQDSSQLRACGEQRWSGVHRGGQGRPTHPHVSTPHPTGLGPCWGRPVLLPLGGSVGGLVGGCEVRVQGVEGRVVEGRAEVPRVPPGWLAGGVLSSQTASELLLAARRVCFPSAVQLRAEGSSGHPCPLLPMDPMARGGARTVETASLPPPAGPHPQGLQGLPTPPPLAHSASPWLLPALHPNPCPTMKSSYSSQPGQEDLPQSWVLGWSPRSPPPPAPRAPCSPAGRPEGPDEPGQGCAGRCHHWGGDVAPRPQGPEPSSPRHSLGPGSAGLVVARGEVSGGARGAVCDEDEDEDGVGRLCSWAPTPSALEAFLPASRPLARPQPPPRTPSWHGLWGGHGGWSGVLAVGAACGGECARPPAHRLRA